MRSELVLPTTLPTAQEQVTVAPYASPSITVAGSLRSLTQQSVGGVSDVGSVLFPPDPPGAT